LFGILLDVYKKETMIYVVERGDTLYNISERFGVTSEQIAYDNEIGDRNLVPGEALLILNNVPVSDPIRQMQVSGYAYPYIEPSVFLEALQFIDEFLIFSYGFTEEGRLIPPIQDDLPFIESAWRTGVEPYLVLTPFGSDNRFNNYLVKLVVTDMVVQQNLINGLLYAVQDRGYAGVDVDFEYILPEDREGYAEFVGNLRSVMNQNGYRVSVALAPKTSSNQQGLLYEGMDYKLLGENADHVFLMTYEWGYTYGPPMAVAPINKVRQVLDYAVQEIPAEKIMMGIPNYAYDWPLPFVRGTTAAKLMGNVQAVRLAAEQGTVIQFDEVAQSPYYFYERDGVTHEVWFEDVRSMEVKLRTASEYGFRGVGYWNLMRPFRANWLLLEELMQNPG